MKIYYYALFRFALAITAFFTHCKKRLTIYSYQSDSADKNSRWQTKTIWRESNLFWNQRLICWENFFWRFGCQTDVKAMLCAYWVESYLMLFFLSWLSGAYWTKSNKEVCGHVLFKRRIHVLNVCSTDDKCYWKSLRWSVKWL